MDSSKNVSKQKRDRSKEYANTNLRKQLKRQEMTKEEADKQAQIDRFFIANF